MARSSEKKLKMLYILEFLKEKSDENHIVMMEDILEYLDEQGISAERKSVYDDIATLKEYGYEIELKRNPAGYRLLSREFELPELKILVDTVQASRFLSKKKSNELIKKLEGFASVYDGKMLQRQVYVTDRAKSDNEGIFYNIDSIHDAISKGVKISFKYLEWSENKTLEARHNGDNYKVIPISLIYNNENYYLVAFDEKAQCVKHYRVDKMKEIIVLKENKDIDTKKYDNTAKYSKNIFGMYGGEEISVGMVYSRHLLGVMLDRFGTDIPVMPVDNGERYKSYVNVIVSSQFFGWLTGLGKGLKIVSPQKVVDEYRDYLAEIIGVYENE